MKDGHFLFEKKPAKFWQEAFPIGSGDLGAMVFGGIKQDKLSLNHDELWSGYPGLEYGCPGGKDYSGDHSDAFRKAGKLALEGRLCEAQDILEEKFQGNDCQAYMPLGDLVIDFDLPGEVEGYSRYLDMEDAVVRTTFACRMGKMQKTAFASFPAHVIVYQVDAEFPFSARIGLQSPLKSESRTEGTRVTLTGEAPSYFERRDPKVQFRYWEEPEHRGMTFEGAAEAVSDGTILAEEGRLTIRNATRLTLYITADTSFVSPSV